MQSSTKRLLAGLGFAVALGPAGPAAAGPLIGDTDGDGIDDAFDNCIEVSNHPGTPPEVSQADTDGDGCGDRCDCDYDNSGLCVIGDFNVFKACFTRSVPADPPPPEPAATHDPTCEETDLDGSTVVTISDFNLHRARVSYSAGPSGNPVRDLGACP